MSNEKPDLVRVDVAVILTSFIDQMNAAIAYATALPVDVIRCRIEQAQARGLFTGSDKALDMLMIRFQCAEEFQRVAKEHTSLLAARLEMED